jgi:hypothetical protein
MILTDCVVKQQICNADYTVVPEGTDPLYQTAQRHLQQAMVPGKHLVSVKLFDYPAVCETSAVVDEAVNENAGESVPT